MKAFILAAGLGKRMRPLTNHLPKPLLCAAGKTLIEHQIERLVAAGITDIVINVSYLADKVIAHLGDGSRYGVSITYSEESEPLETAGGISLALKFFEPSDEPFLLVNGDVWCDIPLRLLIERGIAEKNIGHLLLVPNPDFKAQGDFDLSDCGLNGFGQLQHRGASSIGYTFAGISLLRPSIISTYPKRRDAFALKEVFDWAIASNALSAEIYTGTWWDIGTPERLAQLEESLQSLA